jgi:Flp pilus assembly secretin CpaC
MVRMPANQTIASGARRSGEQRLPARWYTSGTAERRLPGCTSASQCSQPRCRRCSLKTPRSPGRVDAKLSPNVDKLLKPQYQLDIERRHSQLVITNKRVRRIAVTDSTVANYVQYSEKEISVVGLETG